MRLLLFIFSFSLFLKQETFAQNNLCTCVSSEKELKQIETLFVKKEYDDIQKLVNEIPSNITTCKQQALCFQLQLYIVKNKIGKADSIVEILQKSGIEKSCAEIAQQYHLQLGNYYIKKEKNDDAMQQFILVKELGEQTKDTLFQIKGIARMANLFNKMQQPGKAVEYDYLALLLAKKINNQKLVLSTYSNMQAHFGVWYDITEDEKYLDSVRKIATPTLQLAKKLNQKFEISQTYSVLSGVAFLEGKYDKGLMLCDSGLFFLDRNKEFRQVHSLFTKKCDLYIALKDYNKANQYADSSLKYATLENNVLSLAYIYERMYEIAKLQGNFSNALTYHEKFIKIRDSIRTIEKTEKINELEQKYNKAQNEKTIKELSQAKQIASLRNKIYIAGIVLALLIIILIIIYNRQKTLKSKQENMEIEQRLNRARMNPHFFFNTLNSLQTFSMQENKDSKVARYLSKYAKIMRETLESTYKEMNTVEQEVDYLTNYLDIQKLRYPDKFEYHINIDETIEADETYIPAMIIQPFIENSIEHGLNTSIEKGIIELNISSENNRLLVEITDNGTGFTTDKKAREYPSRATQIIRDRLLLLNKKHKTDATYEIGKGVNGIGTSVKIILPLIHTHEGFNN